MNGLILLYRDLTRHKSLKDALQQQDFKTVMHHWVLEALKRNEERIKNGK